MRSLPNILPSVKIPNFQINPAFSRSSCFFFNILEILGKSCSIRTTLSMHAPAAHIPARSVCSPVAAYFCPVPPRRCPLRPMQGPAAHLPARFVCGPDAASPLGPFDAPRRSPVTAPFFLLPPPDSIRVRPRCHTPPRSPVTAPLSLLDVHGPAVHFPAHSDN